MKKARGPVVQALKRYDPGLRVRWSYEKEKWAIEQRLKPTDQIVPPVFYERVANLDWWQERLLPVLSDRYICYHDHTDVICWAPRLDWRLYREIVSRDSHRMKGQMVGQFDRNEQAKEDQKLKDSAQRKDERVYEGWHRLKYELRKNPGAEDGAGVSIKGMQ